MCLLLLKLYKCLYKCMYIILWPLHWPIRMCCHLQCPRRCFSFPAGYCLAQLYCYLFLKKIPFPTHVYDALSCGLSILIGLGNVFSIQIRCISLLTLAMYCGKPGRGVMKAVVLTYVVAGPITNMCLNAQEVVRVFACTTQLSFELSTSRRALIAAPLRTTLLNLGPEFDGMKDVISSITTVLSPIQNEIEGTKEIEIGREQNDYVDDIFNHSHRSQDIENRYRISDFDDEQAIYQKKYLAKLSMRCVNQFAHSVAVCMNMFRPIQSNYSEAVTSIIRECEPLDLCHICDIGNLTHVDVLCDSKSQVDPGLGEGYKCLKQAHAKLTNLQDIQLQERVTSLRVLYDVQDAKQTGELVMNAFNKKTRIMKLVVAILNVCMAILILRIPAAAVTYHDLYLTNIEFDNTYVTGYFQRIDRRRRAKNKYTLLPLKKMERIKYVDVCHFAWLPTDQGLLLSHIPKVVLEVVTATTFVMLDRLFYEALDVVRQHAEMESGQMGMHDLDVTVEGTGILATMVRNILEGFTKPSAEQHHISNRPCLPRPRLMPNSFFFKIYGGYLWIIVLLYLDPYTLRLRRLISSYFYNRREKQRILHLYNDILKKRMKMQKTLRRKAVQAVRAHYLTGESLLSMRMKFPQLLGWLRVLPAARMICLICGETEPRKTETREPYPWHSCGAPRCPFVYCTECWGEVGARCLACDPSLEELSDVDSLSDDEQPRH